MKNNDLKQIADKLNNSPLFQLSLCSKELAHSNFWKWLIELNTGDEEHPCHPFVKIFIPDFYDNEYEFEEVRREEKHRDLSIHYKDEEGNFRCFVVENKLKSLPTTEQLTKYEKWFKPTFKNEIFAGGVLTGIEDNLLKQKCLKNWEFLSYEKISEKIKEIRGSLKPCTDDDEKQKNTLRILDVIDMYQSDLHNISELLTVSLQEAQGKYITKAKDRELQDVRMDDIFLKLHAERVAQEIKGKLETEKEELTSDRWGMPEVDVSFNHKKATITIIYKEQDYDEHGKPQKEIGRLGVQLEGNQFRIYGGPSNSNAKLKDAKILAKEFEEKKWFEQVCDSKLCGKTTKMRLKNGSIGFCKYETRDYTHLYQHWDIEDWIRTSERSVDKIYDEVECSVDEIYSEIKETLKNAKKIIDNDENFTFK